MCGGSHLCVEGQGEPQVKHCRAQGAEKKRKGGREKVPLSPTQLVPPSQNCHLSVSPRVSGCAMWEHWKRIHLESRECHAAVLSCLLRASRQSNLRQLPPPPALCPDVLGLEGKGGSRLEERSLRGPRGPWQVLGSPPGLEKWVCGSQAVSYRTSACDRRGRHPSAPYPADPYPFVTPCAQLCPLHSHPRCRTWHSIWWLV